MGQSLAVDHESGTAEHPAVRQQRPDSRAASLKYYDQPRTTRHRFFGATYDAANERAEQWLRQQPDTYGESRSIRYTDRGVVVTIHILRYGPPDDPPTYSEPVQHRMNTYHLPPGWADGLPLRTGGDTLRPVER